jgi:hypothetical protein
MHRYKRLRMVSRRRWMPVKVPSTLVRVVLLSRFGTSLTCYRAGLPLIPRDLEDAHRKAYCRRIRYVFHCPPERWIIPDRPGPIAQPTTTPLLEHLRKHGKTGKGASRTQKSATSSDVKGRAIASVSAAAAKRAPHADSGPILVAGKGRDVIATIDSAPPAAPAANEEGKKKRTRGKSKGKDPAAGNNAPNATTANGDNAPQGNGSNPPKPPKQSKPKQDRPPKAAHPEGAGPTGQAPSSQTGERGGKTGRGGGGRGRGEGKDRSARGAVTSILSKNAEGEGAGGVGRGGGPGRGRGRGRGGGPGAEGTPRPAPTSLAAASARIDG